MNLLELIEYEIYGNTALTWATGLGLAVLIYLVLLLVRRVLRGRLAKLSDQHALDAFEIAEQAVRSTRGWFLLLASLYLGSRAWDLPDNVDLVASRIAMIVLLVQSGLWLTAAFGTFFGMRREHEMKENPGAVAAMDVLGFVAQIAIWSVVLLFMLDNLGVNITALVAGLGVGGIAVALAAQNILGDLFASLSIILDKPFVVGDFLILGEHMGAVEKVGIKTTRVRSLSGEQLIFSNNDLLGSRIRNYGRMYERRVVFKIGVTYQTEAAQLKEIPALIRAAVEAQDKVRFDRSHFQAYGDFALTFETVYYVLSPDYAEYMNIQQAINFALFEQFEQKGIEFAYPTQTVYVRGAASEPAAS